MAGATLEPMPVTSPVIDPQSLRMTGPWQIWLLLSLLARVQQSSPVVVSTSALIQAAAIGATPLVALANAALYRVSIFAALVQAASVSSSLAVSIQSTYKGQAVTQTIGPVTGNTLGTVAAGSVTVRADAGTPISFSVAYASVGGTPMQYDLFAEVEQL